MTQALAEIRARIGANGEGTVASYIPRLRAADPNHFGLALAGLGGRIYAAGEANEPFTIQSISKPFVYALALEDCGLEEVLRHIGAEPSGEAFNAISLEPGTGRPANPMINAGAIVATALVRGKSSSDRFERIRRLLSAFAGRDLEVDEQVFASELETGDKNRALAYLMRSAGSLAGSVEESTRAYFRQCSVLVSAVDVAVMAATLASGGRNPKTGQTVVSAEIAEHVLAIMTTCGMYDYSGEWLLRVGLPAKSGVSGGVVAVSPGQFGIGLYSPPLDERGNSVRAIAASEELSARLDLHMMHRLIPVTARG